MTQDSTWRATYTWHKPSDYFSPPIKGHSFQSTSLSTALWNALSNQVWPIPLPEVIEHLAQQHVKATSPPLDQPPVYLTDNYPEPRQAETQQTPTSRPACAMISTTTASIWSARPTAAPPTIPTYPTSHKNFAQMGQTIYKIIMEIVEIHEVHWGSKWMGSSDLDKLNNTTSRTAGQGLKTKQRQQQTSGEAKQVKQGALGC